MNTRYSMKLLNKEARFWNAQVFQNILGHADINQIKEKIHIFQNTDIQSLSDKELEKRIDEVLRVKLDGDVSVSTLLLEYSCFDVGERFYRVRKLINTDMPNRELKSLSAYWNPPRKCVKHYGRLNKPGESLLYTAFNPYTAICETNLKSGDPFVLCVYEAIRPLRFAWIGGEADYEFNCINNKKAIEVLELIRKFLVDEFTREITTDQEFLYRITESIAKTYYAFPNAAGWRYPSIKNNFEDNICFCSERVMYNVKLVGAITGIFNKENETNPHEMKISDEYVVIGSNMDTYYPKGSEEFEKYTEKLFPEFWEERP